MGRTELSQGLAPPAVRKDTRAKQARHIVNKVVPAILASNSRARKGSEESELVIDPGPVLFGSVKNREKGTENDEEQQYVKRKGQGRRKAKGSDEVSAGHEKGMGRVKGKRRKDSLDEISTLSISTPHPEPPLQSKPLKVRIIATDTLTAARLIAPTSRKKEPNVCILNMASPLRPGGGILTGATSQEEFLCARTTLLPSLKDSFYRLPEIGAILTQDVLVIRNSGSLGESQGELGPAERYWVDVISAAGIRFPELEGPEGNRRLSRKDKELLEKKMRAVTRIVSRKGAKKVVLGAWGCGAFGNPVADVANAWRKTLLPSADYVDGKGSARIAQTAETWNGVQEIVFAISNHRMAEDFARIWGSSVTVEHVPDDREEEEEYGEDAVAEELRAKILEMESQIGRVWNQDLKDRMNVILGGLKEQLRQREGQDERDEDRASDGNTTSDRAGVEQDEDAESGQVEGDEDHDDPDVTDSDEEWCDLAGSA